MQKPKIAISSCLLGESVRYDGGHKHNRYVTQTLGQYFDFIAFCPEVAIGLGIPRPTIRLAQQDDAVRAVGSADAEMDVTDALAGYGEKIAGQIKSAVTGYILKKDSPTCGMERVKVYGEPDRPPVRQGVGIYAKVILERLPNLPVEEEGRLMDPGIRENFVERVFTYGRWRTFLEDDGSAAGLVKFHTHHKFFIQAHDEVAYRELGRIVASAGIDRQAALRSYESVLMQGLKQQATPARNANVLQHIMGFFKQALEPGDKAELLDLIDAHRRGLVPVIVPITLINHFRRKHPVSYIDEQIFLEPHPRELMLRNHI